MRRNSVISQLRVTVVAGHDGALVGLSGPRKGSLDLCMRRYHGGRPQRLTGARNCLRLTRRLAGKRLAVLVGTKTTWRSMESHTVGFAVFGENETLGLQVLLQQCRLGFANCRRCLGELLHAGSIEARRCRLCVHYSCGREVSAVAPTG